MINKNREYIPVCYPQKGVAGDTGNWRSWRPVLDAEKCVHCQRCWIFCPDACVDRDTAEIDMQYCKGCGICAKECPTKAIAMVPEEEVL